MRYPKIKSKKLKKTKKGYVTDFPRIIHSFEFND